jgi:nucleotide-binding universal stress UspA family protein
MTPRSILAVSDLTAASDAALARAACLTAAHGATLTLIHMRAAGASPDDSAASRLAHQALQLGQRHGLCVRTASRLTHTPQEVAHEARHADLLVVGAHAADGGGAWMRWHSPAADLLRLARKPLLAVRRPADGAYRRLLVALDCSPAARTVADHARALGGPAEVALFDAVPSPAETARQAAARQQRSGADLLVVGRDPASRLAEFLFGSTALRVLRLARGDVLVVPHGDRAAASAHGGTRPSRHAKRDSFHGNGSIP